MTHETYAKIWRVQLDTYDVTDVELGSHPGVLALQPDARTAFAGAVIDGRRLEARVTVASGHEKSTLRDLAVMAQAIAGVYTT